MSSKPPQSVREYLREIGSKGGKAGSPEAKAAAGRKGMAKRWAGHQAKRPKRKAD